MKRNVCLIITIAFILSTFSACMFSRIMYERIIERINEEMDWKATSQPNTHWVSSDGTINFYVDSNRKATGTMLVNGERMEIYMNEGQLRSSEMNIYTIDILSKERIEIEDKYEHWVCSYESESMFVATVEKTTFYEIGQEIVFYRVDNSQ